MRIMNKTYIIILDSCKITTFVHRKLIQQQTNCECKEFWSPEDALAFINSTELACSLIVTGFYLSDKTTGLAFIEKVEAIFHEKQQPISFQSVIVSSAYEDLQEEFLTTRATSIKYTLPKPLSKKMIKKLVVECEL